MFTPRRLLARRPLDEHRKQRLRALNPHDRTRIRRRGGALLAAHDVRLIIHAFRSRLGHRAVSLPGRAEQVEQIGSHAITSESRLERDITPRLSPPSTGSPSETSLTSAVPTPHPPEKRDYSPTTTDLHPSDRACADDVPRRPCV